MSPRFLADENIDPDVVLGLRRRVDDVDIVRVQDVGLRSLDDPEILQQCAHLQFRTLIESLSDERLGTTGSLCGDTRPTDCKSVAKART
ncbi:DUF5615 family PIN-like protein [Nocardioides sp.]|uniref:DUF5615 family PIN-like protein n=1 Tax=Nocardioides sp. TaxID=35761 RepID=UPI0039E68C73